MEKVGKTKTSSKVKDRYNAKVYDEIKVRVKKGDKDKIKTHAERFGESVNGFINRAIDEAMQRDNGADERADTADNASEEQNKNGEG